MDWAAPGNREGVGAELYLASLCEVYEPHAVRGRGILGGVAGRENLCLRTFQEASAWLDVVGHVEASVSVRSIGLEHQVHGWERPSKRSRFRGDSAHGRVDKSLPCKCSTNLRRLEGGKETFKETRPPEANHRCICPRVLLRCNGLAWKGPELYSRVWGCCTTT